VNNKLVLLYGALAVAMVTGLLLVVVTPRISGPVFVSGKLIPAKLMTNANILNNATIENVVKVKTGGGDNNVSSTQFFPQVVEIKTGESVTWYNPTKVPEPHTVTFLMGSLYPIQPFLPVEVSKSSQLTLLPSAGSNGEPIVVPGQNHTSFIIAANARAYNPVVINSNKNVTFLNWNAKYTMKGSEKYINSGWLFPNGEIPPGIQAGITFTITFEKAGLYEYTCVFHPWMTGKVIVR
jgi:plastocyanin